MYDTLRGELKAARLHQYDIAGWLGITPAAVSNRLNGKAPWPLEDCYKILVYLGKDVSEIITYFPPGGRSANVKTDERKQMAAQLAALHSTFSALAATLKANV